MRFRFAFAVFLIVLGSHSALAERLTTATGYELIYDVYPGDGPAALIFMHGKNGGHIAPIMKSFAERVARSGFTVYLPRMPWSRFWDGTVEDAVSVVDTLVDLAAKNGKKVFVGGQSQGANFTMVYRPANPPPQVIGKVLTNPGGMLDLTPSTATAFWASIMPSVERARELDRAGKGKEKTKFSGTNVVGTKSIEEHYETTPEIFLSFHDIKRYPSNRAGLAATKLPVFWSAGKQDPIQTGKKPSFDLMPRNPASIYMDIDGDHNSAMTAAIDPIVGWMKARLVP